MNPGTTLSLTPASAADVTEREHPPTVSPLDATLLDSSHRPQVTPNRTIPGVSSRARTERKGEEPTAFSFDGTDQAQGSSPVAAVPRGSAVHRTTIDSTLGARSMGLSPSNAFSLFTNIGLGLTGTDGEEARADSEVEEYGDEQDLERGESEATVAGFGLQTEADSEVETETKGSVSEQSATDQTEQEEETEETEETKGTQTKALIISDFGDRFAAEQKLTAKEEAWAAACLAGVHASYKERNITALKFFLGPDSLPSAPGI